MICSNLLHYFQDIGAKLLQKKIIPRATYEGIKYKIVAKQK